MQCGGYAKQSLWNEQFCSIVVECWGVECTLPKSENEVRCIPECETRMLIYLSIGITSGMKHVPSQS